MKNQFTFFWGGTFSNWCPSKFTLEGVNFRCVEQYMMWKKAKLFNDEESAKLILEASNPRDQKALGRTVKNFDTETWNDVCKKFVYDGCYAKFTQNPDLLKDLMNTGDTEFCEASLEDKIWGVGMSEGDPDILDKSKWKGTNWLGEVLTAVREDLKKELQPTTNN